MSIVDRYQLWLEQEKDSNQKMLAMLAGAPKVARGDARFTQAVDLAAHLCACRENWLDRMTNAGQCQVDWWPKNFPLAELPARFQEWESRWTAYLANLTDEKLVSDFEYPYNTGTFRLGIETQVMQMVGHAFYHRGQIALLINQLGGETVDTDFLYWAFGREPGRWGFFATEPSAG